MWSGRPRAHSVAIFVRTPVYGFFLTPVLDANLRWLGAIRKFLRGTRSALASMREWQGIASDCLSTALGVVGASISSNESGLDCLLSIAARTCVFLTMWICFVVFVHHPPNWSKMQASDEQCSWVETKVVTGLCQCLCQPIPSEYMKSHLCTLTYVAHSSLFDVWPQIGQCDWVTCPVKSGAAILHDAITHVMFGVLRVPLILSQLLID